MYYVSHFEYDEDSSVYNKNLSDGKDPIYATYTVYVPVEPGGKNYNKAKVGWLFKVKLDKIYAMDKEQLEDNVLESIESSNDTILFTDNSTTNYNNAEELLKQRKEQYSKYIQHANPGELTFEISNITPDLDGLSFTVGLFILPNEDYRHLSDRVKDAVAEAYISYYDENDRFHNEVIQDYFKKHLENMKKLDNILTNVRIYGTKPKNIKIDKDNDDKIFGLDD